MVRHIQFLLKQWLEFKFLSSVSGGYSPGVHIFCMNLVILTTVYSLAFGPHWINGRWMADVINWHQNIESEHEMHTQTHTNTNTKINDKHGCDHKTNKQSKFA